MESLLKNDFTSHYNLAASTVSNICATTTTATFELNDDNVLIHTVVNAGVAKYSNPTSAEVTVLNFEAFINSLPDAFKIGKEKCDLLVYTNTDFLLNELTDTLPKYVAPYLNTKGPQQGKRQKAITQLYSSLQLIMEVSTIRVFINRRSIRRCCFFSKQAIAPEGITASAAFNKLNTIASQGLKMNNPAIANLGFELWEFSGNQVCTI